ncbi:hypothetical protein SVIO_068090 [Streptomyces violaceusniger]|uniref:Uncharacterized protein n=1 Tax=Streptomyces violaceusniger TaxID=68280 RepID=A0A4D4LAF9_STRVO|nr:hypothetical protein SVIO_068090 [Streptomyces violaceusniger]
MPCAPWDTGAPPEYSRLISSAVRRTSGSRERSSSALTTTFGADTEQAATTRPSAPRMGAPTQLIDSSWPPKSVAQPWSRTVASSLRNAAAFGVERGVYAG